jgi:pyridoxal phosphate enzyme (YggS family)
MDVKYADGCDKQKNPMADVAANYRAIIQRIGEAAAKAGRDAEEIKLLGAAKAQSIEVVRAAIAAGVRLIGENYVQEAQRKKDEIAEQVEWHMIGHLQRNKAKAAVEIFDMIQSLDNLVLARELDKEGKKRNKRIRALVEVNLAGEASKSGIAEGSNLSIEGLMAVPPICENPEGVRPYFRRLRGLWERLREAHVPNVDLKELSMGMTHDFTVAVEEGATIVRIGTALFGPRPR